MMLRAGNHIGRAVSAGLMLVSLTACSCDGLAWVELKGKRYCTEIADSDGERQRGLMFRRDLAEDHGMLFLFDREQPQAFWMMNTYIPLDILYFDANRRLVSASRNTPPCSSGTNCPSYPSKGPALYVLELNAGQVHAMDLKPGDELVFGPGIAASK